MFREVGQSADWWLASGRGVEAVVIVEVQPAGQRFSALGLSHQGDCALPPAWTVQRQRLRRAHTTVAAEVSPIFWTVSPTLPDRPASPVDQGKAPAGRSQSASYRLESGRVGSLRRESGRVIPPRFARMADVPFHLSPFRLGLNCGSG